jgi:hypothetical protein
MFSGVSDTGDKLFGIVNDTADKFIGGSLKNAWRGGEEDGPDRNETSGPKPNHPVVSLVFGMPAACIAGRF